MATTTERVFNFSAGPAVMALPVLEEAQRDLLALPGVGMSVLEISHRSKAFEEICSGAEADPKLLRWRWFKDADSEITRDLDALTATAQGREQRRRPGRDQDQQRAGRWLFKRRPIAPIARLALISPMWISVYRCSPRLYWPTALR